MTLQEKLLTDGWVRKLTYEETYGFDFDDEPTRNTLLRMRDINSDLCAAVYDFVEEYINTHKPFNNSIK